MTQKRTLLTFELLAELTSVHSRPVSRCTSLMETKEDEIIKPLISFHG